MKPDSFTGLPDSIAATRAFDRVSSDFDDFDVIHSEARRRLLERLTIVRQLPQVIVDLGSATGKGALALAQRYPDSRVIAVDRSIKMLEHVSQRRRVVKHIYPMMADAQSLPITSQSVDLIFANLVLPWCPVETVLTEVARVLVNGGLLVFTTLGPDTLQEIRRAWRNVDGEIHVHGFMDMHDIGDLILRAGLVEPVVDVDRLQVTHEDVTSLVHDLRACGATNVAVGRRAGLTSPGRWKHFESELLCKGQKRISTTVELIFGQAWGSGKSPERGLADGAVHIPVNELTRTLRGR